MIREYIKEAMRCAQYEVIEDENPFYGEIPGIEGVWATGKTRKECQVNLERGLEDWILFSVSQKMDLPPMGKIKIEIPARLPI